MVGLAFFPLGNRNGPGAGGRGRDCVGTTHHHLDLSAFSDVKFVGSGLDEMMEK